MIWSVQLLGLRVIATGTRIWPIAEIYGVSCSSDLVFVSEEQGGQSLDS